MPFRINPNNPNEVQVFKGGQWVRKSLRPSAMAARRYLAILKTKVSKKEQNQE
jgi:hypothetical protein